jgi:hypothetical protein
VILIGAAVYVGGSYAALLPAPAVGTGIVSLIGAAYVASADSRHNVRLVAREDRTQRGCGDRARALNARRSRYTGMSQSGNQSPETASTPGHSGHETPAERGSSRDGRVGGTCSWST